jgi:hypothetical protein
MLRSVRLTRTCTIWYKRVDGKKAGKDVYVQFIVHENAVFPMLVFYYFVKLLRNGAIVVSHFTNFVA